MAQESPNAACLIAIDGSRGVDVTRSADRLAKQLRRRGVPCAISRWDASGLFGELLHAGDHAGVSPRTLSLVYAADLAFRLRWEIRAALDAGSVVIVAPYIETAVTFGTSCGLPEKWLRELLRFAPQPHVQGLARERKLDRAWAPRTDRGYPEFCAALAERSTPKRVARKARAAVIAALEDRRGPRVHHLAGKGIGQAAKAVTAHTRRDAASPRSRQPGTART